jgi:hypothetical protein
MKHPGLVTATSQIARISRILRVSPTVIALTLALDLGYLLQTTTIYKTTGSRPNVTLNKLVTAKTI